MGFFYFQKVEKGVVYRYISLESAEGLLHILHVDGHELGHEGLQVEDGLAPLVQAVFIECGPLGDLKLYITTTRVQYSRMMSCLSFKNNLKKVRQ